MQRKERNVSFSIGRPKKKYVSISLEQSEYMIYLSELGEVLDGKRGAIADLLNLSSDPLLPRRIGGEQHHRPRQQQRGGVVASEEKGLAFVHDHLQIQA